MDAKADPGPVSARGRFWKPALGVPGLLIAGAAVACACTVTGFLGSWWWVLELTSHFRPQYGAWLAIMAAGLALLRRARAAAFFAAFAMVNFATIAPLYWGGAAAPAAGAARLKLLLINVRTGNQDYDAVRRLIGAENPDVVAIEEVSDRWLAELAPLADRYRRLLADGGLRDSARGHGLQPTWPANGWLLRIPIDHCLISPDLAAPKRRVGPDVGSDHFPLIVTVAPAGAP